MRHALFAIVFWFHAFEAYCQNYKLIRNGQIIYEKKVNVHKVIDDFYRNDASPQATQWAKDYKTDNPLATQFTYFILSFNDSLCFYEPYKGKLNIPNSSSSKFLSLVAYDNIVYSDFSLGLIKQRKHILGETYLVEDSLKAVKWKITDELREICGYTCRRANGLFMDSIYVVAFYTDQIVAPSGPESFLGLPGTILGVALPHLYVTWFATEVRTNLFSFPSSSFSNVGRKVSNLELGNIMTKEPSLQIGGNSNKYIKIIALL